MPNLKNKKLNEEDTNSTTQSDLYIDEIIYPGLILKKDYILLKKIGLGNNAGVWMIYQMSTKLYLAMKIQDPQCHHDGCREVTIIKRINNYCKQHNKNIYCVTMLDYFVYEENEKNKFVCSIYDLYAGNIQFIIDDGKYKYGLPIPVVKKITRQLLTALATLHSDLKIIHTDVKPENILFRGVLDYYSKIIDIFVESEFVQKCENLKSVYANDPKSFMEELEMLALECVRGISELDTSVSRNEEFIPDEDDFDSGDYYDLESNSNSESESGSGPDRYVFNERKQSVEDVIENLDYKDIISLDPFYDFVTVMNNRSNTKDKKDVIADKYVLNCETALTDFGNSYFFEKRTRNEIQDRLYRAPEVILDLNYGYACDIWSVSCVVFELLTGFVLFEPRTDNLNRDIQHLYLMEKMLGPIPVGMKKGSKRNKFLFDKKRNYHVKNVEEFKQVSLRNRLVKQFLFSENEANEIYDFLMCGLKLEPHERSSAKQMLNHPWLN